MKNFSLAVTFTTVAFVLTTGVVNADSGAYGTTSAYGCDQYGANCGQSISFSINKMVQSPTKGGQYVDNLGVTDAKFAPGQGANFEIIIQNNGGNSLENVQVTDTLPQYVTYVSGGSFNSNNNTVTYTINKLDSGQSQTVFLNTKVAAAKMLPSDQTTVCVVNQAAATVDNDTQTDTAQFCIANTQVSAPQPVKSSPKTGPEALGLLALIPTGISGLLLRKKTK